MASAIAVIKGGFASLAGQRDSAALLPAEVE